MRTKTIAMALIVVASLAVFGSITFAQQDRYTLTVPDGGLAFSEFRGYDTWEDVAVSETEGSVKAILGNPATIKAYEGRHPGRWQAFPRRRQICENRMG